MKMCSIVIVIFTLYLSCVQGQSQCSTQHTTTGQCVSLKKCAKLLKLTEQSNRTNADLTLLRESLCGVDKDTFPKVCCEPNATDNDKENQRCFTPYGDEGTCSDMYNCPILANILQSPVDIHNRQNVNYLKNHRCDESAENSVCCTTCKPSVAPPHPLTGCCGIDSLNGKPDGKDSATTYINQYPWLATMEFKSKNETRRLCVGALISSKYVLTSAVCITGKVPHFAGKLINVLLGEYDNKYGGPDCVEIGVGGNEKCTDGAIRIPIEIAIPHGDYNPDSAMRRNDIALLRLRDRVPFTDFIRPICLPTADIPYDDRSIFFAAGWGATEHGKSSFVKLKVELPYVTPEECKQIYYKHGKLEIWEKHLCAGGVAGKDTCKGDSGGPLMYYNGKFYEIAGIVSFGPTRCGRLNYPGVYTKVYEYLPWIRSQMKP